jgi:hypothetical protein
MEREDTNGRGFHSLMHRIVEPEYIKARLSQFDIEPCDAFVEKLFSKAIEDFRDRQAVIGKMDRAIIRKKLVEKLAECTDSDASEVAKHEWFVLTGEQLQ